MLSDNKTEYSNYHDEINLKRAQSPYPLRRYAHERQYEIIAARAQPGMRVLDAGCGEGMLSFRAARRGATVVGCDISAPNIASARQLARQENLAVEFLEADSEQLPFPDASFDLVLSSHVLEHLPDFDRGLRELARVSRGQIIVALPSCTNLAALVQCGGGMFWLKGLRSFAALPIGFISWFLNLGGEGIDEGYAGKKEFHHIWRYPWVMLKHFSDAGLVVKEVQASTILLPYFSSWLPLVRWLDKFSSAPILRWCGYGTTFVLEKKSS